MPFVTAGTGAGEALDARIRLEFESTLEAKEEQADPAIKGLYLETTSNKRDERYHVWQAIGVIIRHPRGQDVAEDSFDEASARIVNHRWSREITWFIEDEEDDQTQMLVARAGQYAIRYHALDMDILVQILESSTDDDLLPAQPSAYDGSNLFLGSTRFGHASGNVVTGSAGAGAYNNVAEVHTDVWAALTRLLQFTDGRGRPYWTPSELQGNNLVILYPSALHRLMNEAFEQQVMFQVDSSLGAIAGAGVSNILVGGRYKPTIVPVQQLTDTNDLYVLVSNNKVRPFVKQKRKDMSSQPFDPSNDSSARKQQKRGRMFTARFGRGIWEPRCAIEVSNS